MEQVFILKVVLSFVLAGLWISCATIASERLGSKLGGLVSNLPSNILIALVFVALVQDVNFAAEATDAVPIGMLIDTVFLVVFIIALRRGLLVAVLISLGTWFGMAVAWVLMLHPLIKKISR